MVAKPVCAAALSAILIFGAVGSANALLFGIYGPKGNDTGGIIPWSPEAERVALEIAQQNCGRFGKFAVIRSVRRVYGAYIAYDCRWEPPQRFYVERRRRPADVTISK
jgi:hypothetical protein